MGQYDPIDYCPLPDVAQPPRVHLPIDLRFPSEVHAAAKLEKTRDKFLRALERDGLLLDYYLVLLQQYGDPVWHHRRRQVQILAGGKWIRIRQQAPRITSNLPL